MPHRRPPYLDPPLYHAYVRVFLTMCAHNRRALFRDRSLVETVRLDLLQTAADSDVEVVAYCFMPDHLHVLACGTSDNADVEGFAKRFRQITAHSFKRNHGDGLWQEGYFDRVLRDEDDAFEVVSYIVANPVRAGLWASASQYPFSGSSRYSLTGLAESVQWRPR